MSESANKVSSASNVPDIGGDDAVVEQAAGAARVDDLEESQGQTKERAKKEKFVKRATDDIRAWMAKHGIDESRHVAFKDRLDDVKEFALFAKTAATCALGSAVWRVGQTVGASGGSLNKFSPENRELCLMLDDCKREATKEERTKRIVRLWKDYVAHPNFDDEYWKSTEDFREKYLTALKSEN